MLALSDRPRTASAADESYEALTLRNRGFLAAPAQAQVRAGRLLIAGCGLGSVVAEVAVRTGFEQLLLADGDTVASHNLNRQVYTRRDVGLSKTASLQQRLRQINVGAPIQTHPEMLTAESIPGVVADADLVIDSIDLLDVQAVFALHREARRQGKFVVSPFTLGWGGAVLVFAPTGLGIEEMSSGAGRAPRTHRELFLSLVQFFQDRIPPYVSEAFQQVMGQLEEGSACSGSQLGVATYLTAALTVAVTVRLVQGLAVPYAPDPIFFDPTASAV